jgi:hypothetical protein
VRKIKDLLRLHLVGGVSSRRQLARAVGCGKTAVTDCLRRAAVAGLNAWETIAELDEVELEQRLYPSAVTAARRHAPCIDHYRIGRKYARSSPEAIIR